jgi:uncharacterized protein (TIGR02145 family)
MNKIYFAIALLGTSFILFSCNNNGTNNTKTITNHIERNSAADSGVKIGNQIWTSFNLDVSKFRNGDEIFYAKSIEEWKKAGNEKKPAWCYFKDDPSTGDKFGKLYNWFAVNDARGLAPEGWHIPTNIECEDLMFALGGKEIAGKKLKSKTDWKSDGSNVNDNSSGFNAFPAGSRDMDGVSDGIEYNSSWWTANEEKDAEGLDAIYFAVYFDADVASIYLKERKSEGHSIRCVKNVKKQ